MHKDFDRSTDKSLLSLSTAALFFAFVTLVLSFLGNFYANKIYDKRHPKVQVGSGFGFERDFAQDATAKDDGVIVKHLRRARPALSDDDILENALKHLRAGNLAYNFPEEIQSGHSARVIARMGSDRVPVLILESGLTMPKTKTQTASTKITPQMKVTLKSADFDIVSLTSEQQSVGGTEFTTWMWDIVPRRTGILHIHLAATIVLKDLGRDFVSVDRDIEVKVDWIDETKKTLKANVTLVWTAALSCIAAALSYGSALREEEDGWGSSMN